jgi:glutamate synthase (NADPH) small chain
MRFAKIMGFVERSTKALSQRDNVRASASDYKVSEPNIFSAGDMRRGQSLVAWVSAKATSAGTIDLSPMGKTELPVGLPRRSRAEGPF